jgi:hypothetical protein
VQNVYRVIFIKYVIYVLDLEYILSPEVYLLPVSVNFIIW